MMLRKKLIGLLTLLLLGGGGFTYGIAHQKKSQPENVSVSIPQTLATEATAPPEPDPMRDWVVKSQDNFALILQKLNVARHYTADLLSTKHGKQLKSLQPEQKLSFQFDTMGNLTELTYWQSPQQGFRYYDAGQGFQSASVEKELEKVTRYSEGEIENSLFLDAPKYGLNDKLILSLAEIFGWDIDFALDIRQGDTFRVLFEENYVDGESIGYGDIVFAEFVNQGKSYQALRYTDHVGQVSYYTPDGYSLHKAFIRTPVNFTRISSKFNLSRQHPVLHTIRAHKGVDYAAPTGTPVKATSDGKITYAARKGGYGNVIEIQHANHYSTLYAHLDHFAPRVKFGTTVKQGQVIGYVGSTGLATGPHLHYEFRINGAHHNPLTVPLPKSNPILASDRPNFAAYSDRVLALLNMHQRIILAKNEM